MATIIELAEHAGVSAENVLRVVHGEPVSEDVETRVLDAIDALGRPPYPRQVEVLPPLAADENGDGRREPTLRFHPAAELEAALPHGVDSAVSEALRVEVQPVAQHVAELAALFERMLDRLERVAGEVEGERRERVEDVALLTELITTGWRSVDRRLGRLEHVVARIEVGGGGRREAARLYRLDEAAGRTPAD